MLVAWLAFAALMPVLVPTRVDALPASTSNVLEARQGACGSPPIPEAVTNVGTLGLDLGDDGFQWRDVSDWGEVSHNFVGAYAAPRAAVSTVTAGAAVKGAAVVGAFLLGYLGTCYALDWFIGDGARAFVPPPYSVSGLEVSLPGLCSDFTDVPAPWPMCIVLYWDNIAGGHVSYTRNSIGAASGTWQGVTIPVPSSMPEFCVSTPCSNATNGVPVAYFSEATGVWCGFVGGFGEWDNSPGCQDPKPNPGETVVSILCQGAGPEPSGRLRETYGGACGLHPEMVIGAVAGYGTAAWYFRAFWPVAKFVQEEGWLRMIRSQTDCQGWGGPTDTHRAVEWYGPYRDRMPDYRLRVPKCPDDMWPVRIRHWRVAANSSRDVTDAGEAEEPWSDWSNNVIDLLTSGGGTNAAKLIADWEAPVEWKSSATAPDWLVCLTSGSGCTAPARDPQTDTCVWGGAEAPSEFCGPIVDPEAPGMPVPSPVVNDPDLSTGTEPGTTEETRSDPGTQPGSGWEVLDPDGNGRIETEAGAPGNAGDIPDGEGGDCWPNGWGWFNPAEWVLKPIKCAFEWAFVPDGDFVANWWDAWLNNCYEEAPCSYAYAAYDFVAESSISFVDWSDGGPDCIDVAGEQVCPRTWDTGAGVAWVPGWVSTAVVVLFWTLLIVAIVKFF